VLPLELVVGGAGVSHPSGEIGDLLVRIGVGGYSLTCGPCWRLLLQLLFLGRWSLPRLFPMVFLWGRRRSLLLLLLPVLILLCVLTFSCGDTLPGSTTDACALLHSVRHFISETFD
jgi:hypothetical protein